MENYRFQLEKTSKKHTCPSCGKRRFVRFIDTQTGQYLPPIYGRCDREANCNYYLTPYADNYAAEVLKQEKENQPAQWQPHPIPAPKPQPPAKPVFIPFEILQATRTRPLSKNTFIQNLATNIPFPFEMPDLKKVADLYQLGTLAKGYFAGAISFPFIDQENRVRAIQIKQFDQHNHTTKTSFIHAVLDHHHRQQSKPLPDWLKAYQQQEKKVTCLFGEQLLPLYPANPVALVEAPKTCIYGTLYFGFPDQSPANLLWLSTFNLSSLKKEKTNVLQGRTVILFPDLSATGEAFNIWSSRAKQFEKEMPGTRFLVSDLLEQNATAAERQKGFDLADYLILQDWKQFRNPNDTPAPKQTQQPPQSPKPLPISKQKETEAPTNKPATVNHKNPELRPETQTANTRQQNNKYSVFDQLVNQKLFPPEAKEFWELTEIETYFNNLKSYPTEPIHLSQAEIINDPAKFVKAHLATAKANNGNHRFKPYFGRLQQLKNILESQQKPP
jgi:hypothetical protein